MEMLNYSTMGRNTSFIHPLNQTLFHWRYNGTILPSPSPLLWPKRWRRHRIEHLFLTNARPLINNIDEIQLRIISRRMNSCLTFFPETWLDINITDTVVELEGCSLFRANRTAPSAKHRGRGLALYVHKSYTATV